MSKFRLSSVTGNRREWFLPVVLFFVVMFAVARAVLELRRGSATWYLVKPLGFWPLMATLVGIAGIAMSWYFRGTLTHPLRKVLALALLALPIAAFLSLVGDPSAALPAGGSAGGHLATALALLPSVLGVTVAALLVLGSGWLAWRLAFARESDARDSASDALARAMTMPETPKQFEDDFDDFPAERPSGKEAPTLVSPSKRALQTVESAPSPYGPGPRIAVAVASVPALAGVAIDPLEEDAPPPYLPTFATTDDQDAAVLALTPEDPAGFADGVEEEFDEFRDPVPAPLLADVDQEDTEDIAPLSALIALRAPSSEGPVTDRWEALERLEMALAERKAAVAAASELEPFQTVVENALESESARLGPESRAEPIRAPYAGMGADSAEEESAPPDFAPQIPLEEEARAESDAPFSPVFQRESARTAPYEETFGSGIDGREIGAERAELEAPEFAGETAPGPSWSLLRALPQFGEPTVILPRLSREDLSPAPSESAEERLPSEAEPRSPARPSRVRRPPGEDWEAWNEASGSRPSPRSTSVAARRTTDEDQQVLFGAALDENLYRRTVEFVVSEERCSVVMLQRKFDITWSTAFALTERMHDEGIVGPPLPSGRREVFGLRGARTEIDAAET